MERFRWFSDDYIAMHPTVPNRIIDIRYSIVPNQIAALWGIDLQPGAPTHQFARFTTDRTARLEQRDVYVALLTGLPARSSIAAAIPSPTSPTS